ncbi:unnamed protein product [Calicophoron daubneyi]|uniref:Uncharacterized protein n=1 Tax=Calicophoron daubneyi TaxID=300641 RepID=A0AAV2T8W0_CALDB
MGENSEEEDSREHETLDQCFAVRPYTFGVNGASAIFSTLAYFPDCTVVTLSGTPLTETALTTIAGNVARLKQLRELGLSKTGIGKFNPQIICRLIRKSPFLRKLDLSDNGFTDTTASAVIDSLLSSELLAELNLSQNHLGLEAGKMVGKLLSESYALKCLNCSWNELKADTVTEIAKGLKENSGLQELNMAWTGTSDLGAWSIGDALKKHEKLTTLNLSANRIKALGLAGLLVGLAENRSLKYLLLQQNPITEAAARDAVQALTSGISSSPIQLIDLSKVVFSSSFGQLVKELEEKRPKLKLLWGYPDKYAVQSTAHSLEKGAQQC